MSVAESATEAATAPAGPTTGTAAVPAAGPGADSAGAPALFSTRFFRSELWLIFGRRRNWVGLTILALVPIVLAIAVRVTESRPGRADGLIGQITGNGLFVAITALAFEMPLFLPIAVAAISGDAIAGEANLGTLRYLLAVPVDRTRLLLVKFGALVVFALAATLIVAVVGTIIGLALFGAGPLVTLSGTTLTFWAGVWRLLMICGYVTICLAAFGAIGMFASTLTEQPIGATIAVMLLSFASAIMDAIPQLSSIQPYLPTHYWLSFLELLRDPIDFGRLVPGLLSAGAYLLIFGSAAWARFSGRDVTS